MKLNDGLIQLINSPSYTRLKDFYEKKSSLDIFGISRKEYAHSNFLYWLLNDKSNHNLGTLPLKHLLSICLPKGKLYENHFKSIVSNSPEFAKIMFDKYEVEVKKISREHYINKDGRLDLFLELKLNITVFDKNYPIDVVMIIENKIYSDENDKQTQKYYKWLSKQYDLDKIIPICIYLTPFEAKPKCDEFKNITYHTLSHFVIERCLYETESDYVKNIIKDYLRCLTFNDGDSKDNISITLKERLWVDELYEEYHKVINDLIYSDNIHEIEIYQNNKNIFNNIFNIMLSENSGNNIAVIDQNMKRKINEILGNAKEYKIGLTTYKSGNRTNSLKKLALAIINDYAQNNHLSIEKLSENLKGVCLTSNGLQLFVKSEEIAINEDLKGWYFEKEDELITIGKTNYSLYSSWSTEEIQKLIDRTKGKLTNEVQVY